MPPIHTTRHAVLGPIRLCVIRLSVYKDIFVCFISVFYAFPFLGTKYVFAPSVSTFRSNVSYTAILCSMIYIFYVLYNIPVPIN